MRLFLIVQLTNSIPGNGPFFCDVALFRGRQCRFSGDIMTTKDFSIFYCGGVTNSDIPSDIRITRTVYYSQKCKFNLSTNVPTYCKEISQRCWT